MHLYIYYINNHLLQTVCIVHLKIAYLTKNVGIVSKLTTTIWWMFLWLPMNGMLHFIENLLDTN